MTRGRHAPLAVCFMLLAGIAARVPASTLWTQGWTTQMPPTFMTRLTLPPELRGVAFDSGGDVLIGSVSASGADEQITRFGADGTLRWSANVVADADAANLVPAADGGAFATFRESSSAQGYAARIDAAGHVLWGRDVPAIWLVEVSASRVAVADCSTVSMLDAAQGTVLWQRTLRPNSWCVRGGIAVDAASNVYAVANDSAQGAPARTCIARFDAEGNRAWDRIVAGGEAGLLGLADGRLYLDDDDSVIALDAASGSELWRASGQGELLAGEPREPIVFADGVLRRLRAADGSIAWSAPVGNYAAPVSAVGDAIVANTDSGLSRIDAATGVVAWTVALPVGPRGSAWASFGGLAGGAFTAIGNSGWQPLVQRVDFASGAMLASIDAPPVAQGVDGYGAKSGGDVVSYAVMNASTHQDLEVRSVDGTSGAVRWDATTPIQESEWQLTAYTFLARIAGGPASIATAVPMNSGSGWESNDAGAVRVVAHDRVTGAETWNVVLNDFGQGYTSLADLVVDANDNVVVALGTTLPCNQVDVCGHQTIYRLAAADGHVIWRDDHEFGSAFASGPVDPPSINAIGDDVLAVSNLHASPATVRRLASANGAVLWESDEFAAEGIAYVYAIDAARVVAFRPTDGTSYEWAAIDGTTGGTLGVYTKACGGTCSSYAGAITADGDLLFNGRSTDAAPALTRVHDDGSGNVDWWAVTDTSPDLRSFTDTVSLDDDGRIWLSVLRLGETSMGSGSWYGYFDASAGALESSQTLPGLAFAPPAGNSVLTGWAPPDGPTQFGVALVDRTITATGNLAAAISIDRTHVMPNDLVGFDVSVAYEGDAPISGARLTARMPWASGATGLACTGTGVTNCTIDARSHDARATFDIAPGGAVHVTGHIRVLDVFSGDATRYLGANARGPEALNELETVDNFARTSVVESLFFGGFDD